MPQRSRCRLNLLRLFSPRSRSTSARSCRCGRGWNFVIVAGSRSLSSRCDIFDASARTLHASARGADLARLGNDFGVEQLNQL